MIRRKIVNYNLAKKLLSKGIRIRSIDAYASCDFRYFPPRIDSEYVAHEGTYIHDVDNCESEYSSISASNLTIPAPTLHDVEDYFRDTFDIFISIRRINDSTSRYLYDIEYPVREKYVSVPGEVSNNYYDCLSNAIQAVLDDILPMIKK